MLPIRIAITAGEPAGIGPDLCVQLAQNPPGDTELVVFADPTLLQARAQRLGLPLSLRLHSPDSLAEEPASATRAGTLSVLPISLNSDAIPGQLNSNNSPYVLETLDRAIEQALEKNVAAVVTGPVQKSIINDAGITFSGHTEYFAKRCGVDLTVMMLATPGLRVALATTHLPLAQVAAAITQPLLDRIVSILVSDLQIRFGIEKPKILVCGLNPHAGEGGHLGREEIETIEPALRDLRDRGYDLIGPLPADTLFTDKYLDTADAVLAMYHDQGLPVLKYKGFGRASNITLGLPIIRTSVDHGTALDLAGSGGADAGSLYEAIGVAIEMTRHSNSADSA